MIFGRAIAIWIVLILAEILHGIARGILLVPHVGEFRSNQIGVFTIPDLLQIKVVRKPAVEEHKGINPFTKEEMIVKAKPATNSVKLVPLKGLKAIVQPAPSETDRDANNKMVSEGGPTN